ncbi:hypothetical protein RB195_016185 [Necator americanus]|uniref:Uncharacterized protein n=1 Tax=Necator americanus TaxID=51031 RepID=A0ABR1E7X7_NECAM
MELLLRASAIATHDRSKDGYFYRFGPEGVQFTNRAVVLTSSNDCEDCKTSHDSVMLLVYYTMTDIIIKCKEHSTDVYMENGLC